jgi:hypothetical protein
MERILEAIDAPNRYRRALEGLEGLPRQLSPSFVAGLARKEGLRSHPYRIVPSLRRMARELGVWERPFDPGVTPRELMERGFRGKALGEELERRRRQALARLERSGGKEGA